MKQFFLLLALFVSFSIAKANMGVPYSEGSTHSAIYGNNNCIVSREKITIGIHKRVEDGPRLYAVFHILYHIEISEDQTLPLLFIGKNLSYANKIEVNQRAVVSTSMDSLSIPRYPFVTKDSISGTHYAQYTADEKVPVDLSELIYFKAPLLKGQNTILVEYEVDFVSSNYGFRDNFQVDYSLYPSRFWKSFGPIEVTLQLNNLAEITNSNLGKASIDKDTYTWNLDSIDKDIHIVINYQSTWLAKALLFIGPGGIALLASLLICWLHFRWMNSSKKRTLIMWLGIFLVPIFSMAIFLLAYPLIDYVLGRQSRHGYVFLIVLYYPAAVLCYGLAIGLANLIFRKK